MTIDADFAARLETEIRELHSFFVDWFAGRGERSRERFADRFTSHLAPDFELVTPKGVTLAREPLEEQIFTGFGKNAGFRIRVQGLRVRAVTATFVLAVYEEWQLGAATGPARNARVSSAMFLRDPAAANGVRWLHVHETALSPAIVAAGT